MALVLAVAAAIQVPGCSITPVQVPARPVGPVAPVGTASQAAPVDAAFQQCRQHFPGAVPRVAWPGRQRALCFDAFAVLHSGESRTPVYTVERLTAASLRAARQVERVDRFYPEARLPAADRAQLADYRGSGYDRGHMAPAGDMPSEAAKAQSFSLANMVPQVPELNQRDWSRIEQDTRRYAARAPGEVYVFTGPAWQGRPATIGAGRVWVPSHTWKLVYSRAENRAWAYWMENSAGRHSLKPIGYARFSQLSGLDLLPGLEH